MMVLAGAAEAGVYDGAMTALIRMGVLGCLLAAGAWAEDTESPTPTTLKVMAWNIHHGEGEDGKLDLERIAGVIKKSAADVVLLQEVDDRTQRTGRVAQAEELARLTGLRATFGKAMDFQGGGYGNAILTRWAPAEVRVLPLPGGGEPRCALAVTVEVSGNVGKMTVVSTHLDVSSAASRATHAKELATEFAGHANLVILGGDFNATPDEAPLASFADPWIRPKKEGTNTGTIPVGAPTREIDFILIKPAPGRKAPTVVRHAVIEETVASDHRPVFMELQVPVLP
jgi:endonuclease/exonuclease/phosphatase family metal-dependent hydrolase